MIRETIVKDAVQAFCNAWFVQRDVEETSLRLTDDVNFIGTGYNESAQGKEAMAAYIRQDIQELQEPFSCDLSGLREQVLAEHVRSVYADMTLANSTYTWFLRAFFILQESDGIWQVKNLHFAEPGRSQRGREHYPQTLVAEKIHWQRMKFLNDALAGGMMGGYIEDGFPFYFINRRMLDYLGYEDEADFVADIGGYVSHCMHPDDRRMVDAEVACQLAGHGEYAVEYRMKKKTVPISGYTM